MPADVLDQLRESNITVSVHGKTLDLNPDPPKQLKPALVREARWLLTVHRQAEVALDRIVDGCGDDAGLWLKLRDLVCKHWRDDAPEYRYFVSWIASHHMRADAYRQLNGRKRSTFSERASWRADITFNDRMIAFLTPRLLNLALLNPALHSVLVNQRVPQRQPSKKGVKHGTP